MGSWLLRPQQGDLRILTFLLSELQGGCGDGLHFVSLDGDVSLHQLVLLEQVFDLQQVLPKLSRQEVSLAKGTDRVEGIRRSEETLTCYKRPFQRGCPWYLGWGVGEAQKHQLPGMEGAAEQEFLLGVLIGLILGSPYANLSPSLNLHLPWVWGLGMCISKKFHGHSDVYPELRALWWRERRFRFPGCPSAGRSGF